LSACLVANLAFAYGPSPRLAFSRLRAGVHLVCKSGSYSGPIPYFAARQNPRKPPSASAGAVRLSSFVSHLSVSAPMPRWVLNRFFCFRLRYAAAKKRFSFPKLTQYARNKELTLIWGILLGETAKHSPTKPPHLAVPPPPPAAAPPPVPQLPITNY